MSYIPAAIQAPSTRPTFRTDVNAVLLDVRVVDDDGKFVADLTKNDFRVVEDGKEQTVSTFSRVNIPVVTRRETVPGAPRIAPDTASNAHADDGRLYVLILDDIGLDSNPLTALRAVTVRALARDFIEHHVTEADQVALVTMSGRRDMTREFTHDTKSLLDSIDRFSGYFGDPTTFGLHCGQAQALESFAKWLGVLNGRRKSLVFITENVNRTLSNDVWDNCAAYLQGFLSASARGNVSLYIVDPTGVPTGVAKGVKPLPLDDVTASLSATADRRMALEVLAETTGGAAFGTHSNDFAGGFDRIVEENSSYYVLSYTPTNDKRDGKLRNIKVEVNRPRLKVRTRTGYLAEDASAKPRPDAEGLTPELDDLLKSPIPVGGLTLGVTAVPFRSSQKGTTAVDVVVDVRATSLLFENRDARLDGSMDIAIAAADQNGKIQTGERGMLTMHLLPETREALAEQGVRILSSLQLKPGRYRLKVAATDTGGGQGRGSVLYELTVPDFSTGRVSMSGLALAAASTARTSTNGSDVRWKPLGAAPTTNREFVLEDELRVYAEIYDSDTIDHLLNTTTTVRSRSGQTVLTRQVPVQLKVRQTAYDVVVPVPLKDLAPGDYVLTVEVRSSAVQGRPVSRQIPFSVRARTLLRW